MTRILPGPLAVAAWFAATVTAPLVFFEATHRWEEHQQVSSAVWWAAGAAPVLTAGVAGRGRRTASGFVAAVATGAVFLGASLAVFRWVIPLTGAADWWPVTLSGLSLAICGAAAVLLIGPRPARSRANRRYALGVLVAVLGALLTQTTLRLGAEGSTVGPDLREYGAVGPYAANQGVLSLPAKGRYAIFAVGPPDRADCRISGAGPVDPVTIPPGDYGGDYATYAWVASFAAPAPGAYTLTCDTADASYMVSDIPEIRGAVGAMIHWPLPAIWLLGALPGLLVIAARRRSTQDGDGRTPSG